MISQFTNISSWRQHSMTIEPHEVYTLNFRETLPNIFVLHNPNLAVLKIGISSIPRSDAYEFKIDYNTTETFGRPIGTNNIYILNDSSIPVNVSGFSIEKEFEPALLKNMNVSLDGYTLEANSEISGVKAGVELPVSNKNTDANIVNMSTVLNSFDSVTYPAILEKLQTLIEKPVTLTGDGITLNGVQTDLTTVHANLATLITKLGLLDSLMKPSDLSGIVNDIDVTNSTLSDVYGLLFKLSRYYTPVNKGVYLNNVTSFEYVANNNVRLHFGWLLNDGDECNISVNGDIVFTIYGGEQLSDFEIELSTNDVVRITSDNPKYRIKYWTY